MPLYSAIQPIVKATQWFKNGDHPDDHVINNINSGRVVGRLTNLRSPEILCKGCGNKALAHGKLMLLALGQVATTVCPGDYIETVANPKGKTLGYKLWKQKQFELFYTKHIEGTPQ